MHNIYQKAFTEQANKYGSRENIPQEIIEVIEQNSVQQAQTVVRHNLTSTYEYYLNRQ